MGTDITINRVAYTIEKLDTGNIKVTHRGGQIHPMQGPDTDGNHVFEVHPCQARWYSYWNDLLPPGEQKSTGPGRDGERPWWSSKAWKRPGKEEKKK